DGSWRAKDKRQKGDGGSQCVG
ncbi:hypothetical protein EVA_16754, partial [gut metagenome]